MRRLCGETQLPDRLLGKDPSSSFANLLFLSPLHQRLSLKGTPFQGPRASQEAGRMAMPSAPLPPGPSLPKWPPGWGWTDPQVSARALPWRVLRVICPPIAGSGEHGHLRLASWPHHRAALAASSPPPVPPPPPPWPAAAGMAGRARPSRAPPTHSALPARRATHARTPLWPRSEPPPSSHPLPEPPPTSPHWCRRWDLSCLFT